jgi:hypothetical protein
MIRASEISIHDERMEVDGQFVDCVGGYAGEYRCVFVSLRRMPLAMYLDVSS